MCVKKPKTPAVPKQEATPTITPEPTPPAPVLEENTPAGEQSKKKGTSALRINLTLPTGGASGLNIPA